MVELPRQVVYNSSITIGKQPFKQFLINTVGLKEDALMLLFILIELCLVTIISILNLKIKNKDKLFRYQYLFNFVFILFIIISPLYLQDTFSIKEKLDFFKITILIAGSLFYATDYIRYLKDKNNIALAQKAMKSALINHAVIIGLLAIIFVAESCFF